MHKYLATKHFLTAKMQIIYLLFYTMFHVFLEYKVMLGHNIYKWKY